MHPKQPIEQIPRKDRFGRLLQDVSGTENDQCHCGCTSHPVGERNRWEVRYPQPLKPNDCACSSSKLNCNSG